MVDRQDPYIFPDSRRRNGVHGNFPHMSLKSRCHVYRLRNYVKDASKARIILLVDLRDFFSDLESWGRKKK